MDEKEDSKDRIEAYKTAAEASANIYKLVAERTHVQSYGLKQSKLLYHDNQQESK